MSFTSVSVFLIATVLSLLLYLVHRIFNHWKSRGWPHDPPHWFFGNLQGIGKTKHFLHVYRELYAKYKGISPVCGLYFFFQPVAFITDLDLAQRILVKDFSNFADRGIFSNESGDPLSAHLFALDGLKWRNLRNKLSSAFTSGKMKKMFPIVIEVADRFCDVYKKLLENESVIEIKDLNARYTTDVIGTCAFGIDCNSLADPNADFRRYCGQFFTDRRHNPMVEGLILSFPKLAERLNVKFTPQPVSDFFLKAVDDTVAYREDNKVIRNDFMSMLIDLKNHSTFDESGTEAPGITMGQLAAQAFVFFVAGFETSSTTMGFCLYELSLNPEIQKTLRAEILSILKETGGELTYDSLNRMSYLEKVLMETLRKYSILQDLIRIAQKDYKVPGTNFVLEKGSRVMIPTDAIHYDPDIYPDPQKFDPERFDPEEIKKRHPMAWLPFGEGPRNCIGLRFGKMQTKIGLITLLRNFEFSKCEKTAIPIEIDKGNFLVGSKGGIYLKVKKL
ncbi:hypothetical protein ACFFRR_010952 [Megaselia abdita]